MAFQFQAGRGRCVSGSPPPSSTRARRANTATTQQLADIIRLYPDEGHCVGFAHSKRRRCANPTNAPNRSKARALLVKGTTDVQQGKSVDNVLDSLAPLVLCTRNHQNQAAEVAEKWKRKVEVHLESIQADARSSPPSHNAQDQPARNNRSRNNVHRDPTSLISSGRTQDANTRSSNDTTTAITQTSIVISLPSSTGSNVDESATANDTSNDENGLETPPSTTVDATPRETSSDGRVTRKVIEGDCGICRDSLVHKKEGPSSGHDLVWCRAECGNNLHKACFEPWKEEAEGKNIPATCPFCRVVWNFE